MAGLRIAATFDDAHLPDALDRLAAVGRNTTPVPRATGVKSGLDAGAVRDGRHVVHAW